MIEPTRRQMKLTALQCDYLKALRGDKWLGRQVRGRLWISGVRTSNGAFYRVMQRLKNKGLVESKHARQSEKDYRGQEYYYTLTEAGHAAVGPNLELHKGGEKKANHKALRRELERIRACLG